MIESDQNLNCKDAKEQSDTTFACSVGDDTFEGCKNIAIMDRKQF